MIGGRNTVTFVETLIRWVRCAFGNVLSIHVVVRSKTASNSNWPFCFAEWVGIPKKSWPGLTNISWLQLGVQSVLSCILDTVGHWWDTSGPSIYWNQQCPPKLPHSCHCVHTRQVSQHKSQRLQVATIRSLENNAKQS